MKNVGIYIHIPFCVQKCAYCDFISFCNKEKYYGQYVEALKKEIVSKSDKNILVDTVYIGGGTPSIISESLICDILKTVRENYKIVENAEITIEANPRYSKFRKTKKI